jgi:hypothetical protein
MTVSIRQPPDPLTTSSPVDTFSRSNGSGGGDDDNNHHRRCAWLCSRYDGRHLFFRSIRMGPMRISPTCCDNEKVVSIPCIVTLPLISSLLDSDIIVIVKGSHPTWSSVVNDGINTNYRAYIGCWPDGLGARADYSLTHAHYTFRLLTKWKSSLPSTYDSPHFRVTTT